MATDTRHWERRVDAADAGMRLDAFWARELEGEGVSREKVKEWILSGGATADTVLVEKPKYRIGTGAALVLRGEVAGSCVVPEQGPLHVLHEDADIIVVDKPAGLTTHPAPNQPGNTLVNRLVARYPELCEMDSVRPGIVHRLDKDTSGVMVVARNEKARLALVDAFASRRVDKLYLALAHGVPEDTETDVNLPMGRHPRVKTRMAVVAKGGKPAKTKVRVLWHDRDERMSFLAVRIYTGRTHQVRVHLGALEHPLLGDVQYGPRRHGEWKRTAGPAADLAERHMLHAYTLAFDHPATGERMRFCAGLPEDFSRLLAVMNDQCLRVGLTGAPGSGKSSLLRALGALGVPTFSADRCVAELYGPGGDGAQMLAARFGGRFEDSSGGVDKAALFSAMRESDSFRREVMEIVHPMVRHRMREFFAACAGERVAVAEVPLLAETGWGPEDVDVAVGVRCSRERRTGEFAASRSMDPDTLAVLDSWQWPEDRKLAACDLVVDNDGSLDDLAAEAGRLLERLVQRQREQAAGFAAWLETTLGELREAVG